MDALQPVRIETKPSYPKRKATLVRRGGRWVRRVCATFTVAAAASFGMIGCHPVEIAGAIGPGPDYFCPDGYDDPVEVSAPGRFSSTLCEDRAKTGTFEVAEQMTLRFSFDASTLEQPSSITADVVDPSGAIVGTLVPGEPLFVEVSPGTWQLIVSSTFLDEGDFTINIDLSPEE